PPTPELHPFPTRRSSDLGGMAEKVKHGVNGLHFRANDAINLAETIRMATSAPGLWDTLSRGGMPALYPMDEHIAHIERLYRGLLDRKSTRLNSSHQIISY